MYSCREEALRAFKLGVLSLRERAEIDRLFDQVCLQVMELAAKSGLPLPKPLQPETRPHSHIYHINLSGETLLQHQSFGSRMGFPPLLQPHFAPAFAFEGHLTPRLYDTLTERSDPRSL